MQVITNPSIQANTSHSQTRTPIPSSLSKSTINKDAISKDLPNTSSYNNQNLRKLPSSTATMSSLHQTMDINKPTSSNFSNVSKLVQFRNTWRGVSTVLIGAGPSHALYFATYERARLAFGADCKDNGLTRQFLCSGKTI